MAARPLTPLEAACGGPLGGGPPVVLGRPRTVDPLTALEEATLPALEAGPCRVAFSGGLDSSVVLAAAVRMARRAGLPDPVPLTFRFPHATRSHEDPWQELVVRHLRLDDWERVELEQELDVLGSRATALLRRIGPYWPANAHMAQALLERTAPGTLLTGEGGDDLFAWRRWGRASDVLARRRRPRPRDVATVAVALAPAPLRRLHDRSRAEPLPWLRPAARRAHARAVAAWADVPWRWDEMLAWVAARDDVTISLALLDRLAADAGARVGTPLLDHTFLAALAAAGGPHGFGGRRSTWTAVFGDVLPGVLLQRQDKAAFNEVFWGPQARAFALAWSGCGLPEDLVEPEALRAAWLQRGGDWRAADLLQRAWLLMRGD